MRALVLLAVLGVCAAFIPHAPDVEAERARFFQAYRAAQAAALPQQAVYQATAPVQPKWTGPVAATVPAGVDGRITPVSDTAEVSAARNAFLSAYNAQVAATVGATPSFHAPGHHVPTYNHIPSHHVPSHHVPSHHVPATPQFQPKWTGPVAATIPAGLPGAGSQVADTPEVAAAKAQFFNTFQRQAAAAAPPSPHYF